MLNLYMELSGVRFKILNFSKKQLFYIYFNALYI